MLISTRVPTGNRWHTQIGKCEGSLIKELFAKVWAQCEETTGMVPGAGTAWGRTVAWSPGEGRDCFIFHYLAYKQVFPEFGVVLDI
mgnify:CR=1 FL=1